MNKKIPTILVLDANQRSALAVTRSLGKHTQLRILTADASSEALAGHSRYSVGYFQYPSIYNDEDNFNKWLVEFSREHQIDWIFPITEVSSQSALQLRDQLLPCRIPFAPYTTVMALADKWQLINLARTLAVPYPESRHFDRAAALNVAEVTTFPVVVKPCLSRIKLAAGWLNSSVHIAASAHELQTLLDDKIYLREHPFILQEFIPGHGAGIFALYDRGQPIAFFAHQRLREKPPSGGVSTLSASVTPDAQMLAMAKKLLDAAAWHGVAMIEFRVAPDGKPYLMEVNTRFWGSLQLAIDAGVDFPALLLQISQGEAVSPMSEYRVGRRMRWLLGDIDSLYLTLRAPDLPLQHKLRRLLEFATPHPFTTRHEINRWSDLGPARFELKTYLKDLFG